MRNTSRTAWAVGMAVALVLVMMSGTAMAAYVGSVAGSAFEGGGGMKLGQARVFAGVKVTGQYTDNFFITENNEQSLWIARISPRVGLRMPFERHVLKLTAESEHLITTDSDAGKNYNTNRFIGAGEFLFNTSHVKGKVFGEYRFWNNRPLFDGDDWKDFNRYMGGFRAGYTFANVYEIAFRYRYTNKAFTETLNNIDDVGRHDAAVNFYYQIMPKTRIFFEGGYTGSQYDNRTPNWDNNLWRAWAGVHFDASAIISGELAGGWSYKDWRDSTVADNRSFFGVRGNLTYKPFVRTKINLAVWHEMRDNTFTTQASAINAAYFLYTGVSVRLDQVLYGPLAGWAAFRYSHSDYTNVAGVGGTERKDDKYTLALGLDVVVFKRWKIGASYRYQNNDSNITGSSFKENQALIFVRFEL